MPAVKKKPAAKTAAKGKGDWFHKKSPAAQKAYIAKHPNSIYAKQAKKAGASPTKGRRTAVGTDPALAEKYGKMLDKLHDREPNPGTKAHEKWAAKERELALKHRKAAFGTRSALQLERKWAAADAKRAKAKTSGTATKKSAAKKSPEVKKVAPAPSKPAGKKGPKNVEFQKKELARKIKAAEKSIEKAKTKVGAVNARARLKKYKEMLASYP